MYIALLHIIMIHIIYRYACAEYSAIMSHVVLGLGAHGAPGVPGAPGAPGAT